MNSTVELTELELDCEIATYTLNDIIPSAHLLDLKLSIDPELMLIETDGMMHVFDYDPLMAEINRLARDRHYETQERLLTRIVNACADQPQVTAVEVYLRKTPVTSKGGTLGICLKIDSEHLAHIRKY